MLAPLTRYLNLIYGSKDSCVPGECRALARLAEFIVIGIKGLSELVEIISMNSRNFGGWLELQVTGRAHK
jgi:hypothetical protein